MSNNYLQIAIDGYAGCGKSTLARNLAKELGIICIPSGDIYRFVTYVMMQKGIAPEQVTEADLQVLKELDLAESRKIQYQGQDIFNMVYPEELRRNVALYAQIPIIRSAINAYIRSLKNDVSAVVEGRDIGSKVLPTADLKYFLFGSIDYRIKGWEQGQLREKGFIDMEARNRLYQDTIWRDRMDETRSLDPLVCAEDAIRIDVEQLHNDALLQKVRDDVAKLLAKRSNG